MSVFFLTGNFAPVREERTITGLPVTGRIPDFLDGRYLRNGPNPASDVDAAAYHWFTADGMVHGVRIRDGRAEWYRNRWADSPAIGDLGGPVEFGGTVGPGGCTSHPKLDPATGETHSVSYRFGPEKRVRYSVTGADGQPGRVTDIEVSGAPMMHDFSLTRSHVVLYDLPVTHDARQAAIRFPFRWDPDYPARVGVMRRDGEPVPDAVRWFEVEPCFVMHALNAYDDSDTIVLDIVRYDRVFDADPNGPSEGRPTLHRWTVDLARGKVRQDQLDDRVQDFPRCDDRLAGRRHRFGYAPRILEGPGELLKHDLDRGEDIVCSFGESGQPGEFTFVPRSADSAEDDGVLMGFVYSPAARRSDLVLLDAATLETAATVHLPVRVPHGCHGNWIPDARRRSPPAASPVR